MDPVVTVDADTITVEPGGQASVVVRVRNLSMIVEGFRLDVLGDAAPWAQVLPGQVEVLPQGEAQATVLFTPPSGIATRAGQVPFAVRAVSQVDPSASAVTEADLHVGGVSLSQARITPATSRGRWSGRHRIELSNWGNAPLRLALDASDPDEALGFLVVPQVVDLPLGTTATVRLKVRARKPFFRGAPVRRPFRVVGRPVAPGAQAPAPGPDPQPYGHDPGQPAVDGVFEQRPLVGRGVLPLAGLALVVAGTIGFVSSRGGDDPAAETVAPPTPRGFSATALGGDTVRLEWEPGERADSYTVFVVDPATKDDDEPTVRDQIAGVPGDQGQLDVPDLDQGTEHCFQLAAVRGEATSARTELRCATTAQVAGPGAPATPTDVAAERDDDGQVRVTWTAPDGAESHLVIRGDTVVAVVEAPLTEALVDTADDERCFQVQARAGDLVSEPSDEVCVAPDDDEGGAGGTGTGGPAPGNLGVIAVPENGGFAPLDDPSAAQLAEGFRNQLRAQGVEAGVLLSTEYPDLEPPLARATYLVYIPGFDSPAEAVAECAQLGFECQAFTPGTPRPGAQVPTVSTAPPTTAPPA